MWLILVKYGVPEKLVNIIKSFHDNMQAGITVNDNVAHVTVSNGLRQGCVMCSCPYFVYPVF